MSYIAPHFLNYNIFKSLKGITITSNFLLFNGFLASILLESMIYTEYKVFGYATGLWKI